MSKPVLHGMDFSVYVRIARLVLEEKGVPYGLNPVDVFSNDLPTSFSEMNPFRKMPVFVHGSVTLYETQAITRYVDEAFAGPPLQPETAPERAKLTQIQCVADNYLYRAMVWGVFVQRLGDPAREGRTDETVVSDALSRLRRSLPALERLFSGGPFVLGPQPTLADLHLFPMFDYFLRTPDSADLMRARDRIADWWRVMRTRESVAATVSRSIAPLPDPVVT